MNSNSSYTHMTSLLVKFGCVVMALLVVFGFAGRTVAAQTEAPANLDIIVVIDNSGYGPSAQIIPGSTSPVRKKSSTTLSTHFEPW